MLDLGSTEFHLAVPSLPEQELRRLSTSLFDSWEEYVETALSLRDYSLFLQVEEGSVRGLAKIGAVLGVLYMGIGNYGDFISGVNTIREQVSATGDFLTEHAKSKFSCPSNKTTTRKRGGTLASLQQLFAKVQRGEISPDEATARAEALLGDEGASTPGFLASMAQSFHDCPRHHEQQPLPFVEEQGPHLSELPRPRETPRPPRPTPALGPVLQLRIEVWRESKKKRRQTRVVKL